MPIYTVQGPDGKTYKIEGPEGATAEQLGQVITSQAKPKLAPINVDPTEGMSSMQRGLAGAGKFVADTGRGVGQMLGLVDQASVDEAKRLDAPLMNTTAGKVGNFAGAAAGAVPLAMIPGANTLVGASLVGAGVGATQPTATGESRAENAALGAAGGFVGQGAANLVGRALRPVQGQLSPPLQDLAKKAAEQGIPLTPAQLTGSKPLKIIEAVMENLPFTAGAQAEIKQGQRAAFNRAVLKQIGEDADLATPEVLTAAKNRIGGQFNKLTESTEIKLGDDFLDLLTKLDSSRNAFSSPQIKGAVDKALELAAQGKISGRDYQNARTSLTNAAKGAYSSDPELGQVLKALRGGLDDAAGQSIAPADKAAWDLARKQWGSLKTIEKAAAPTSADAVAGNVSPAKLAQALMSGNKQAHTYGQTGEMGDLARIGQAFIKDQVPSSGTAERNFYQSVLENPLRVVPGAAGLGAVPIQKLMNSQIGQKYLTQGALPNTEEMKLLARILRSGATGAGTALANPAQQ